MRIIRRSWLVLLFVAVALVSASAQHNAADTRRLVAALGIRAGSVVAEIGAGTGELTVAMAREVGADGRVFSNELSPDRRGEIARAVEKAGLRNVTIVEGSPGDANLPAACCDAIFMRNVYHHFADPAAMNATLLRALKPGGAIAIVDFTPPGKEADQASGRARDNFHGLYPETVVRELQSAGFETATTDRYATREFIVTARRPAGL
jgi:ubiquinone/menaquinone biosynthesis C-methylase UbiE